MRISDWSSDVCSSDLVHVAYKILLRTQAHQVGFAIPSIHVLGQIRLGDFSSRWIYHCFQMLEPGRSSSLAGQHRLVTACSTFVEPTPDAIGAIGCQCEFFHLYLERLIDRKSVV